MKVLIVLFMLLAVTVVYSASKATTKTVYVKNVTKTNNNIYYTTNNFVRNGNVYVCQSVGGPWYYYYPNGYYYTSTRSNTTVISETLTIKGKSIIRPETFRNIDIK